MLLNKAQRGFTLLEVAVVLVIIGLVAGMLLPTHRYTQRLTEVKQVKTDLQMIRDALQAYAVVNQKLPCPADKFEENDSNGGKASYSGTHCKAGARYLPWRDLGIPARDRWGNPWRYRVDKNFVDKIKVDSKADDKLVVQKISIQGSSHHVQTVIDEGHVAAIIFSTGEPKPTALMAGFENQNLNPNTKKIAMMDDVLYDGRDGGPKGVNDLVLWIAVLPLKNQLLRAGVLEH